jgi:hypothetical protein
MCAFKQNLFIPPLVQDIWMCIQAKPSHPSPCQDIWMCIQAKPFHPSLCSRHLHVHSSKNLTFPPLKTFVQIRRD